MFVRIAKALSKPDAYYLAKANFFLFRPFINTGVSGFLRLERQQ